MDINLISGRTACIATVLFVAGAACDASGPPVMEPIVVKDDPVDVPLHQASADDLRLFIAGDALFDHVFTAADGLGPLYIRSACSACHANGGRGPGLVRKLAPADPANVAALPYGPTIRPFATSGATPLIPPMGGWNGALLESLRIGPAVWGRGYLEAIADSEIERVEAEQALRSDGIHGRINHVVFHSTEAATPAFGDARLGQTLIGRFGLKARVATLDDFSADALQGDMGMTTPQRPNEPSNPDLLTDDQHAGVDLDQTTVVALADYIRRIELPSRNPTAATPRAAELFEQSLCSTCHVPSMTTRSDYPIALLAGREAPIYSDLLLHDMGDELADGLTDESATGREWRTAPLIGLRFFRAYLHDGRASSLDEAIRLHGGAHSQAQHAVDLYNALDESDRDILLRFVGSL